MELYGKLSTFQRKSETETAALARLTLYPDAATAPGVVIMLLDYVAAQYQAKTRAISRGRIVLYLFVNTEEVFLFVRRNATTRVADADTHKVSIILVG